MNNTINQLSDKINSQLKQIVELNAVLEKQDLEKQDLIKSFFLSLIKILDSFENKDENLYNKYENNEVALKIIKSYSSIHQQILDVLEKHGVRKLLFNDNRLIVGYSKVVETEPNSNLKNDDIISIVKNGYIRGKELIREAELIVVKN